MCPQAIAQQGVAQSHRRRTARDGTMAKHPILTNPGLYRRREGGPAIVLSALCTESGERQGRLFRRPSHRARDARLPRNGAARRGRCRRLQNECLRPRRLMTMAVDQLTLGAVPRCDGSITVVVGSTYPAGCWRSPRDQKQNQRQCGCDDDRRSDEIVERRIARDDVDRLADAADEDHDRERDDCSETSAASNAPRAPRTRKLAPAAGDDHERDAAIDCARAEVPMTPTPVAHSTSSGRPGPRVRTRISMPELQPGDVDKKIT